MNVCPATCWKVASKPERTRIAVNMAIFLDTAVKMEQMSSTRIAKLYEMRLPKVWKIVIIA